jgi:hypothetical protein
VLKDKIKKKTQLKRGHKNSSNLPGLTNQTNDPSYEMEITSWKNKQKKQRGLIPNQPKVKG